MYLSVHGCQRFPDTDYWVETFSGRWTVKPKAGFKVEVMSIIWKLKNK